MKYSNKNFQVICTGGIFFYFFLYIDRVETPNTQIFFEVIGPIFSGLYA